MWFHVVDPLSFETPKRSIETNGFIGAPSIASVMWMPFPRSVDPVEIDMFVANTPAYVLRSDAVVIGLHADAATRLRKVPYVLDDIARRTGNVPALVVYSKDGTPIIEQFAGERMEELESDQTLKHICEQDVAEVVRRPGGELPKHPGIHYEGPNGDHYEAFLRPGFGARSIEELDRLAFWLAPILRNKKCLVVDHWSMIAIAYHVGSYLADMGDSAGIKVASVGEYGEDRDVLRHRLKRAFGHFDSESGAVLVSVNSSGRLVRNVLLPTMTDLGFKNATGIALARTPNPAEHKLRALTSLSDDFRRHAPADCPACARESNLIPIQHDSYMLNLAAYTQTTTIKRADTRAPTSVIERYAGIGAFSVHRTHSDDRHHAFFVNLEPILEHGQFRQRLRSTLLPWRNRGIELVLHPEHDVAAQLASMVAKELGVANTIGCDERRLSRLSSGEMNALVSARRICMVDDVVISGARVFGYRAGISGIKRTQESAKYALYCLVGIARATSEKALMSVSDVVHHSSADPRFLSVERLFLPKWHRKDCRWCAELRILSELPDEMKDLPLIRGRLEALRDPSGLVDGLFLPWTDDQHKGGGEFWKLGPESVFGEVQGADLAISVAAAIQRMRGERRDSPSGWRESELDDVFRSPVAKVLDSRFFLGGRFHEPAIVAAILRASKGHDLMAPGNGLRLQERVASLASTEGWAELHGELMLAARLGQLPRTSYEFSKAHPDIEAAAKVILRE